MTDSVDPDYHIKFLDELGRAEKLDLQGKLRHAISVLPYCVYDKQPSQEFIPELAV